MSDHKKYTKKQIIIIIIKKQLQHIIPILPQRGFAASRWGWPPVSVGLMHKLLLSVGWGCCLKMTSTSFSNGQSSKEKEVDVIILDVIMIVWGYTAQLCQPSKFDFFFFFSPLFCWKMKIIAYTNAFLCLVTLPPRLETMSSTSTALRLLRLLVQPLWREHHTRGMHKWGQTFV